MAPLARSVPNMPGDRIPVQVATTPAPTAFMAVAPLIAGVGPAMLGLLILPSTGRSIILPGITGL